ncbi:hypothetical protein Q5Z23_36030, partial [Pseudomonas aeruginosa]|uniref:hypothetical protein n=1 Tax=Pseudomonas aeruginosa TaxID=287 RepID=UPI002713AA25
MSAQRPSWPLRRPFGLNSVHRPDKERAVHQPPDVQQEVSIPVRQTFHPFFVDVGRHCHQVRDEIR